MSIHILNSRTLSTTCVQFKVMFMDDPVFQLLRNSDSWRRLSIFVNAQKEQITRLISSDKRLYLVFFDMIRLCVKEFKDFNYKAAAAFLEHEEETCANENELLISCDVMKEQYENINKLLEFLENVAEFAVEVNKDRNVVMLVGV